MSNDTPAVKACTKCGEVKPLGKFTKDKSKSDGLYSSCKSCKHANNRAYYEANRDTISEKAAAWVKANPQRAAATKRAYREANGEQLKANKRAYYEANRERINAKHRAYHEANKDKIKDYRRAHYEANREEMIAKMQAWYEANRGRVYARVRAWQLANPEATLDYANRRRARKKANGVYAITDKELRRIYSSPCAACGSFNRIEADHVIPIARGGHHGIGNLQPLCKSCNCSKGDRLMVEWMATRP